MIEKDTVILQINMFLFEIGLIFIKAESSFNKESIEKLYYEVLCIVLRTDNNSNKYSYLC